MGILSVVNQILVSNSKSQLKHLSSSSNLWFIRRISNLTTGLSSKAQQSPHSPTADLKKSNNNNNNNNNKLMFLIEHFKKESGNYNSWECLSRFPPYSYSLISAENSWTDHHDLGNPFSGFGNYILADSCNELMLFFLYNMDAPFSGYGEYLLWNPTTDKIKILPTQNLFCVPAFTNIHGFGFDSESKDYKMVRFPFFWHIDDMEEKIDNEVMLYSLKTNSWKQITEPRCDYPLKKPPVRVNGIYYWKTTNRTSANIILSFDFANEKFSSPPHIPRPPKFDEHTKDLFVDDFVLVEFDGSLAALVHSELGNTENPFSFEVWGWNGETWLERMSRITIDVPGGVVKVVGLFQNDKLFLHGFNKGELMIFDLPESKLENLGIHADPEMVNIFPFNVRRSIPVMGNK